MKTLYLLGGTVLALFSVQLSIAYFLPIYTDEIGFKWDYARAFLDGGRMQLLTISCRADPTAAWPWLWIPARAFDAVVYEDLSNLSKLRVMGLVYAGIFLLALRDLVGRAGTAYADAPSWLVFALAVSFCALGVLPFLMVMNRPELELTAGVAALVALTLRGKRDRRGWLLALVVALLQYYLYSRHPKALMLVPLFLACWLALPGGRTLKVFGALWTAALAASLFLFYSAQLQCPDDSYVRSLTSANVLVPGVLFDDPRYFVWRGLENLLGSLQYIDNIAFRAEYLSHWLPPDASRDEGLARLVNLGIETAWLALLAVSGLGLLALATRRVFERSAASRDPVASAVFLGLVASVALTCFFQTQRNDYRSTQILLAILLGALLASIAACRPLPPRIWRPVMALAFGVGIASQIAFLHSFARYVTTTWAQPGPTPGQPFSVNHVRYASYRREVVRLAQECGIREDRPPEHLVLDDSTYPAFWRGTLPYHLVYLTGGWANGIGDLKVFLEQRRYGGIVARCDLVPSPLRTAAKAHDGLCCVLPGR